MAKPGHFPLPKSCHLVAVSMDKPVSQRTRSSWATIEETRTHEAPGAWPARSGPEAGLAELSRRPEAGAGLQPWTCPAGTLGAAADLGRAPVCDLSVAVPSPTRPCEVSSSFRPKGRALPGHPASPDAGHGGDGGESCRGSWSLAPSGAAHGVRPRRGSLSQDLGGDVRSLKHTGGSPSAGAPTCLRCIFL